MGIFFSFFMVIMIALIAYLGVAVANLHLLFGIIIPYAAFTAFVVGFLMKVVKWGRSPVPFHIPTTCGQQMTLPWINYSKLDNPSCTSGVISRMILEVFCFRSLFRNLKTGLQGGNISYGSDKWLWLAGLAFHYSFAVVVVRHLRFFMEPVPALINIIDSLDGFLQITAPHFLLSGGVLLLAAGYLFFRRVNNPQVRYISLPADYFPLFLIIGIALSGILMRYIAKVDIIKVKQFTISLVSLQMSAPEGIGVIFFIHLFLICTLLVYFPFSKLMHMGGIFLSPTRNLANDSRIRRHVNPWNPEVKVHTYAAYEDEFRDKMKGAGIPVEKE
ncbi:MAG: sulfate reduction electron transfer complex DsrMKJOP subunit DsrM [Nitrospirae bacterium]|nr:sulfate reduction electron transfer complex DsrMKJOP subunit DsrM [Nitrospirota bacterium]